MSDFIRLKSQTKHRLSLIRTINYDNTVSMLLDYFDATGINPKSKISAPSTEIRNGTERIIKILRAFEKTYFSSLEKNIEILQNKLANSSFAKKSHDESFDKKEVEQLVELNKNLNKRIEVLESEKQELKLQERESNFDAIPKSDIENKIKFVFKNLKDIQESFEKSNIETGKIVISERLFNEKIKLVKSELNSI